MAEKTREELIAEVEKLRKEIAGLKQQQGGGASGWLITTPHPSFSGQTMNIQFRKGAAFIPDAMDGERIARQMVSEFGYNIEHLESFLDLPAEGPARRSMIDMLMIPERR
jgi:hypothetical protein